MRLKTSLCAFRLRAIAAVVGTAILLCISLYAKSSIAGPVCYRLPFGNPDVTVYPWGAPYDDGSGGHHRGTDFPQSAGTPIPAAADGVVAINEYVAGGTGNAIVIAHADGMFSGYSHMVSQSPLDVGTAVSRGQILGNVGLTGRTTGYHLHLTMTVTARNYNSGDWSTTSVNPVNYINAHQTCCSPSAEVCDGVDNDCDGAVDEDEVCEQSRIAQLTTTYAPPKTTDINGDGRADVCGRSSTGFTCSLADGKGGVGAEQLLQPLSNAFAWNNASSYPTLRMGDIDGDGKADLCSRANAGILCWTSARGPLATAVEGPRWSSQADWTQTRFWSTIRLMDMDGDGKEDICARNSEGIVCHRSIQGGFGPAILGPRWSDKSGFTFARYYSTLRTGDVNGDGKDDLCVRGNLGMFCALSTGTGFAEAFAGPAWSDASGWDAWTYYASIQLADVNGDGKADLCARSSTALNCHFSTGTGFGPGIVVAPLSNVSGWWEPANLLTFRTGDIDGDGAAEICARANTGVRCYSWKNNAFQTIYGPTWSNAAGFTTPQYYETIRMGDIDGDGKSDICARGGLGWACAKSTGVGFADTKGGGVFTDAQGWAVSPYYNTLFFASPIRIPKSTPPVVEKPGDGTPGNAGENPTAAAPTADSSSGGGCSTSGSSMFSRSPLSGLLFAAVSLLVLAIAGRRRAVHT